MHTTSASTEPTNWKVTLAISAMQTYMLAWGYQLGLGCSMLGSTSRQSCVHRSMLSSTFPLLKQQVGILTCQAQLCNQIVPETCVDTSFLQKTQWFLPDAVACKLIKEARGGHDVIYALFAVSPAGSVQCIRGAAR